MVTLKDVMKSINVKLKKNLPTIPIQSTDIKEGFSRPCLYVSFDDVSTTPLNSQNISREIDTKIYFFPTDIKKNKLEILEVQDIIEKKFLGRFQITEGFNTMIEEIQSEVTDGVLICEFKISYIEEKRDEDDFEDSDGTDGTGSSSDSGRSYMIENLLYNEKNN